MKKTFLIQFVQTGVCVPFLALLWLLPCGGLKAQGDSTDRDFRLSCPSTWTRYNSLTAENSIVRSNNMNHVAYMQEKETSIGNIRHTFIVRRYGQTYEMAFSTNLSQDKIHKVIVTDMRLFEDTCYFCGRVKCQPTGSGPDTRGFVGRFVTTGMKDSSWALEYYVVDSTSRLDRLAISRANGYPLLISAIGERYFTGKPCIVELENNGSSVWKIAHDTITNADNLDFSDIMTIRDSITLLAQYACVNDNPPFSNEYDYNHQMFLLDRFSLRGCRATYISWPCHMALYYLGIVDGRYFHHDRTPMRLFHINDHNNEFGVAFGVEEENDIHGGVRLFTFHHAWRYDRSIYFRAGINPEIVEIGNMYKSDTLYALSKDDVHPDGVINILSMSASNYIYKLRSYQYPFTYNSLTQKFAGSHISISGDDNTLKFQLFDQHVYNPSWPTCFQRNVNEYETFSAGLAEGQYMGWWFSDKKDFKWEKAIVDYIQVEPTVICEECN